MTISRDEKVIINTYKFIFNNPMKQYKKMKCLHS